jgi:hypothetical protein
VEASQYQVQSSLIFAQLKANFYIDLVSYGQILSCFHSSLLCRLLDARGATYKIEIFTQGCLYDFDLTGVEIFSDVYAIWSMRQMIEADILICLRAFSATLRQRLLSSTDR